MSATCSAAPTRYILKGDGGFRTCADATATRIPHHPTPPARSRIPPLSLDSPHVVRLPASKSSSSVPTKNNRSDCTLLCPCSSLKQYVAGPEEGATSPHRLAGGLLSCPCVSRSRINISSIKDPWLWQWCHGIFYHRHKVRYFSIQFVHVISVGKK